MRPLHRAVRAIFVVALLASMSGPVRAQDGPPPLPRPEHHDGVLPKWAFPAQQSTFPSGEGGPIEPQLLRLLRAGESDALFRVIVQLREQADLEAAVAEEVVDPTEARSRVVSALQTTATRSQASLLAYLERARAAGGVERYTSLWVVNAVAVHADRDTVLALTSRPDVAAVRLDHYRKWLSAKIPNPRSRTPKTTSAIRNSQSAVEWNISHIRAPQVWSSLHISGTGAVVAGMDTGVDWLHPVLQANYRGYNPHGPPIHTYSWYDATGGGALYPVDDHGHGSHTLGTIVGQGGIGVSPGARWIGVKVLDNDGYGYDSWIHEGFQWVLAPGGDPAQAPDVINCSWGDENGSLTTFQPDLQVLRAAGIFAVFANGNNGPGEGTVMSPASLPEAFAVGATDGYDEVASFSSRGPSPWEEIRPHVAAPGVNVRSALPGGAYGQMNGTSTATPHVSGIAALLRSVSPTLSITRTAFIITSTAVPLGAFLPNNDAGWGRVDAFAAVAGLGNLGFVTGTVSRAGDGAPVSGATVAATPHASGGGGTATTDDVGNYLLALAPTTYDLTTSAFGYDPETAWGVVVTTDTTTVVDFSLTALPTGTLSVHVTDAATGQPLVATVSVLGTPLQATAGTCTFTPPAGTYTISASRLGYRVVTVTAAVTAGQVTTVDLALPPGPSILLLDSGGWYYESQAQYFRQALDDLAYVYHEWPIRYLPYDVPEVSDLAPYDIVVWSAPHDAPGYIDAQGTITGYLSAGGWLLLSGQDIGYLDGGGAPGYWSAYYEDYLKTRYVSDDAQARVLEGLAGDIFAGLTITITGAGGADNQDYPDEIGVADPDAAAPVLAYQGDGCGGVRVGTCLDYRAVYLSFGFEAINDPAARREVMDRALGWLATDPPAVGLELTPVSQTVIGLPGSVVTHSLRVRHVGQGGSTDVVALTLKGATWPIELQAGSLTLAPCTSATVVLTVTIPATAGWDARDVVTLTAQSSLSPTLAPTAVLTAKAPAPILLVDDDRWYEQRAKYQAAMAEARLPYDLWQTGPAIGGEPAESPSLDNLQRYPVVVWWTGYDWYEPVTPDEEATLAEYLNSSGRLSLSSQDFLYYHHHDTFSRDFLGVLTYTEDVTPTVARGVPEDPIGDRLGPWGLDHPFPNWSDGVEPTPGTAVPFRDQERRGIALARREGGRAATFFAFPFEALPEEARPEVMRQTVGWLSWLGGSTFAADRGGVASGDTLTYTLQVKNDGPDTVTASVSNTLPVTLILVPASLTGPAAYDPVTRRVSWEGPLGPGAVVTVTYRATVAAGPPSGTPITNAVRLGLEEQDIRFRRSSVVRVGAPDLSPSAFWCTPSTARPGAVVTCTLGLLNAGPGDASAAKLINPVTADASLVAGSLAWTGGTAQVLNDTVHWTGPLGADDRVTVTYQLALPRYLMQPAVYSVAFLEDSMGGAWERPMWVVLNPWRAYLPVVYRRFAGARRVFLPVVSRDG